MQLKKRVVGAVGLVEGYAAAAPPKNTIKANGAQLDRSLFWRLFKHAQESGNLVAQGSKQRGQYGDGDGLTTFTIPDFRGVVGRGFDDGAGLDSAPTLGRYQGDDNRSHSHGMNASGDHNHQFPVGGVAGGGYMPLNNGAGSNTSTYGGGNHTHAIHASGGTETTMKNVSLLYCIRYQ